MKKIIHIDFLPNFEDDDFEVVKNILKRKVNLDNIKSEVFGILKKYFPNGNFYFFSSARGALYAFLKFYLAKLHFKKVLTQAYTCCVVPNSIRFAGGIPVYVDIEEDGFNISLDDLKKKIDRETSILIIQNTFGFPADYKSILEICKENNILLIENLAHSFGAKFNNVYLGNFSDISLLTFGRSKVISSLIGGALVINNTKIAEQFDEFYKNIPFPLKKWRKKQLIHFFISWYAKKFYTPFGRALMYLLKRLKITAVEIEDLEKKGMQPKNYACKFPPEFYPLLLNQLKKLERFNTHRQRIAEVYLKEGILHYGKIYENSEPIFLRYPMFSTKANSIIENFKKYNIYIGDWYKSPIAPITKGLHRFGYHYGMCPNAEKLSLGSYNLPTNINTKLEDAYLIATILKSFYEYRRS